MTTNENNHQEQPEERGYNAQDASADLNRTDANNDAFRARSQQAGSNDERGNWDTEGSPADDRPEGQAQQGDKRKEQGDREQIGYRPNQTGDDRINKQPTDPGRPSANTDEDEDDNEFEREDQESDNEQARNDRDHQSESDREKGDGAGRSDFDQERGDETSRPVR